MQNSILKSVTSTTGFPSKSFAMIVHCSLLCPAGSWVPNELTGDQMLCYVIMPFQLPKAAIADNLILQQDSCIVGHIQHRVLSVNASSHAAVEHILRGTASSHSQPFPLLLPATFLASPASAQFGEREHLSTPPSFMRNASAPKPTSYRHPASAAKGDPPN